MPEPIEPGCYYHIYNRGINRQDIFTEKRHYQKFLELCKKYIIPKANVLAYSLLPNHFHFLLYIKQPEECETLTGCYKDTLQPENIELITNLKRLSELCQGSAGGKHSLFLSHLFNAYAQWFNLKTSRVGGLFQRPFKRKRVTNMEYLKHLVYYTHRNPLYHNIVNDINDWEYSSYKAYLCNQPTLVSKDPVLEWFGDRDNFEYMHKQQIEIDMQDLEE